VLGYLDNISVGGNAEVAARDVAVVERESSLLGLQLNHNKSELMVGSTGHELPMIFLHFAKVRTHFKLTVSHNASSSDRQSTHAINPVKQNVAVYITEFKKRLKP